VDLLHEILIVEGIEIEFAFITHRGSPAGLLVLPQS
jgi:hypothetical protein